MADIFGIVIVRPFGILLMTIFEAVHSYGFSIILFALIAKLLMLPLAYKGKKGMLKMTAVQGRMQDLQKKYANNKVKLNEEIQKLYEKENVNPMGGCLPTFITLPIMMGLYYVVQKPLTFMMGLSESSIGMLGAKVGVDVATAAATSVTYQIDIAQGLNQFLSGTGFTEEITKLATDIQQYLVPIDFNFLGLDLSATPQFTQPSILWLIPILSGATAFLSSYVMQKVQGNAAPQGQMKTMMYMMPLMSVYFGFAFPAAIGIYWVANNILTMAQEVTLTKIVQMRHPLPAVEEGKKKKQIEETTGKKKKKKGES